tara:strand:+ start:299 stop:928 length:630 start_codon:yes stop_codon:yes gene_type:complete
MNKKELETEFANDFSTPIFPILGELYLKDKDLKRAEKVCKVGLQYDPENINGYYILAKVHLYNNQLNDAEKVLSTLLIKNPMHINALRLIITIQQKLKKSNTQRLKYLSQLFDIFPNNQELKNQIEQIDNEYLIEKQKTSQKIITPDYIPKSINFNVQSNMATITFVEILKQQKHYEQALHVLSIIESKSSPTKNTKKLKTEIQKLLSE